MSVMFSISGEQSVITYPYYLENEDKTRIGTVIITKCEGIQKMSVEKAISNEEAIEIMKSVIKKLENGGKQND